MLICQWIVIALQLLSLLSGLRGAVSEKNPFFMVVVTLLLTSGILALFYGAGTYSKILGGP